MSKVVHLTSVHSAYDVRIYHKECLSLLRAGYPVALIALSKNRSEMDTKELRAILLPQASNRLNRVLRGSWQLYREALRIDASLYHFHDPELIPVGIMLKLSGKKVIYDVHEDLPKQVLSKDWIPRWMRGFVALSASIVEKIAGKILDGIVAATPSIAERFPKDKTVVVQNFPLLSEFAQIQWIPYPNRPPNIVYVGGITAIRGVYEMVRAMEFLPESLGARLLLVGSFTPPELEEQVCQMPGWACTEYLGWQSRKQVAELFAQARIGLVLFHPEPNHTEAQPNKLFEYMSAGIPVVASDFPLWREIVEGVGCGLLVNPLDPQAIAEAITWLLEHPKEAEEMGQRGRQAVLEKYNWEREAEKLLELYRRLL